MRKNFCVCIFLENYFSHPPTFSHTPKPIRNTIEAYRAISLVFLLFLIENLSRSESINLKAFLAHVAEKKKKKISINFPKFSFKLLKLKNHSLRKKSFRNLGKETAREFHFSVLLHTYTIVRKLSRKLSNGKKMRVVRRRLCEFSLEKWKFFFPFPCVKWKVFFP